MTVSAFLTGGRVILTATFEVAGAPADPDTVLFLVRQPNGTLVTYEWSVSPEVAWVATGEYTCTFDIVTVGRYRCRTQGTGVCTAASEAIFEVLESDVL